MSKPNMDCLDGFLAAMKQYADAFGSRTTKSKPGELLPPWYVRKKLERNLHHLQLMDEAVEQMDKLVDDVAVRLRQAEQDTKPLHRLMLAAQEKQTCFFELRHHVVAAIREAKAVPSVRQTTGKKRSKKKPVRELEDSELCKYLTEAKIHARWEAAGKPDARTFLACNQTIHTDAPGFNRLRNRVRRRESDHGYTEQVLQREHDRREKDFSLVSCECK